MKKSVIIILVFISARAVAQNMVEVMRAAVARFDAISERITERQFPGGRDEDLLAVQPEVVKPQRGSVGAQLENAATVDESHGSTDE